MVWENSCQKEDGEDGVSGSPPLIIFLTAAEQHALCTFEVRALDCLLKLIESERFAEAIAEVRHQLKLQSADSSEARLHSLTVEQTAPRRRNQFAERFTIRTGSRISFVLADDIDWIEAVGDYAALHIRDKTPLLRETLTALEERLDPARFVRIHRSAIVQVSRICELRTLPNREFRLRLTSGADLKVSRTYRDRLDRWLSGE